VLNVKISEAKRKGIEVVYKITSNFEGFDDLDMCYILGNLLDNAITATLQCDKPFIDFLAATNNGRLKINIKNSFNPKKINPDFSTTKQKKDNHGLGLKSVKRLVKKNEGDIDYFYNGDVFTVLLVL
jgi:sensor histidine kinase regulating citrate/malate metabolism